MAQEFTINSAAIESKINQLLPSQGGFGAGIDFSASTMVIPIVDLTESAEGSNFRQDLQRSLSLKSVTAFSATSGTTTVVNTTGYFKIIGSYTGYTGSVANAQLQLTDGTTTKTFINYRISASGYDNQIHNNFEHDIFLEAGDSFQIVATNIQVYGSSRQIADISGNLVNP